MIPGNLMDIIKQYNENGVFMNDIYNRIYWFNGKRFEFWCQANGDDILFAKNDIYVFENNQIFKWQKKKFQICKSKSIIINCFRKQRAESFICLQNGSIIKFENNQLLHQMSWICDIVLHPKRLEGNAALFKFKQFIYIFQHWRIHKFDLNRKQWVDVQENEYVRTEEIVQLNERLYFFNTKMECTRIFNLLFEKWETVQKLFQNPE